MSEICTQFTSHRFSGLLVLLVVVGTLGVFLPQPSPAHASAALPTDSATHVPVLLLHGLEGLSAANCTDPTQTYDRWGYFRQLNQQGGFAGYQWGNDATGRSLIHTLAYFNGDFGCSDTIPNNPECSNYPSTNYGSSADVGTNNEDIRHIACRFYWYVFNNYTYNGIPVNILAHSMGGIIAKWALSMAAAHIFPHTLLVYNVVTLSTPFQGEPYNFGPFTDISAGIGCGGCYEGRQLENGSPDSIIGALNNFSSTEGYWTVIGSIGGTVLPSPCDAINADLKTVLHPGPSLASARSVDYSECIYHEEPTPGSSSPGSVSYQDDASTNLDWEEEDCSPIGTCQVLEGQPHALAMAFEALGILRGPDSYPPVYDVSGGGIFFTVWENTGGLAGPLGAPTDSWYSFTGGQAQDFQHGSIYWSPATGTEEVQGGIYSEYVSVWGGPVGGLGFPTTNELGIANGRVSYFYGNLCGGRGPYISGAAIYWTSTTGAHQVGGCIYNKYWHMNGPSSQLNFPTSDVLGIAGGYVSYFYGVRCGGVANGPYNSGSAIYNSSKGTYYTQGCVYAKYQQIGATGSFLGYPVSDENTLYNSGGSLIGWSSYFAGQFCGSGGPYGSGSAIYVPASNNSASGGHEVHGCIYNAYINFGGPTSALGFPISDEYTNSAGQRESDFQGGNIIWWNGQAYITVYGGSGGGGGGCNCH